MAMIFEDLLREEISDQPFGSTCELKKEDTSAQCVICHSLCCMVVLAQPENGVDNRDSMCQTLSTLLIPFFLNCENN